MQIKIPYGENYQILEIPEDRVAGIHHSNPVRCGDEQEVVAQAMAQPLQSMDFNRFIEGCRSLLIVVNDATRPTPTRLVLDLILPMLGNISYRCIVATGSHRAPSESEMEYIFGNHYAGLKRMERISVHDAKNEKEMILLGNSRNGTEIRINRLVMESQGLLVISSVEPHYFAGYTGGRKSILPGLAAHETITQNHRHALALEAQALALDGNPVHTDMIDTLELLGNKPIFSVQLVLESSQRIYAAFAGNIEETFLHAVHAAKQVFAVKIPRREDIVVSVAPYPMDIDLYQAQKAIDNGKLALNHGGILIAVSKCRTGIGPDSFYQLMAGSRDAAEILEKIRQGYQLGFHKAAKLAEIGLWAKLWAVTSLEAAVLERICIRPFSHIQQAVDTALESMPEDSKVIFLLEGSLTVPLLNN